IDLLPDRCQTIFKLSRYEQMSYAEIAKTLDISPKTVENQIGKALKILRKNLLPQLFFGLLQIFQ
ncbi:sigma-70 family RNA polymerase sigma factor, partial [Aquiflexum sp.]|uniref:sigma-70 family RNA polymerase sigma factor n=1 Tax=Aquiflexum sp. TaxID=1872584 RepID=UPI003593CB9E